MQPFAIGTVVRFKNNESAQAYGRTIYGRVDRLMISGLYAHDSAYFVLSAEDGSKLRLTGSGYVNATPAFYLELDIFMHACRQAIKETPSE